MLFRSALERELGPVRLAVRAHALKFHDMASAAATLRKALGKIQGSAKISSKVGAAG